MYNRDFDSCQRRKKSVLTKLENTFKQAYHMMHKKNKFNTGFD